MHLLKSSIGSKRSSELKVILHKHTVHSLRRRSGPRSRAVSEHTQDVSFPMGLGKSEYFIPESVIERLLLVEPSSRPSAESSSADILDY